MRHALEIVPGVTQVAVAEHRGTRGQLRGEQRDRARRAAPACRRVVTNGWGLLELRPLRMSLEEIFLHLTTEETPHE